MPFKEYSCLDSELNLEVGLEHMRLILNTLNRESLFGILEILWCLFFVWSLIFIGLHVCVIVCGLKVLCSNVF